MARDGDEYNSDREREQRILDRQTGWKPMTSDPTREALIATRRAWDEVWAAILRAALKGDTP